MLRITTCFAFLLSLMATCGVAQNQRVVDSLECVLATASGNDRISPLIDLAIEFVDRDNGRALTLIEEAHTTALTSGDSLWTVKTMRIKGQIVRRLQRFDEALLLFSSALSSAERNGFHEERLRILIPYALVFTYQSQYDRALRMYSQAHELAVSHADTTRISFITLSIGVIYYKLKNYSKALQIWQSALSLQKEMSSDACRLLINISLAYANMEDYHNARRALNESTAACGNIPSKIMLVHIHYASGFIFFGLKDYVNAEPEFLKSYVLSKGANDIRMLLDNIYLLADVYQKTGRANLALWYLKEGEKVIDNGIGFNLETTKIYQRLSEIYLHQQNFKKAALYQARYINLKDSIYGEELTTSLMKAEADHHERFNKAQIASQKEMILLKEEVIERQGP